ncbi:hypothetical protein BH09ACT8_BH09ACT8_31940 [soil metagenome]
MCGFPEHRRLILAVIAVGLIALAGGAAVYSVSSVTSGLPTAGAPSRDSGAESGVRLSVSGIGENRTLVCNDGAVSISGISSTVVISGHCLTVQISGVSNVVMIESTDAINASGIENRITFRTGAPAVVNSGSGNTVEQG